MLFFGPVCVLRTGRAEGWKQQKCQDRNMARKSRRRDWFERLQGRNRRGMQERFPSQQKAEPARHRFNALTCLFYSFYSRLNAGPWPQPRQASPG